jgi:hypothetical protein
VEVLGIVLFIAAVGVVVYINKSRKPREQGPVVPPPVLDDRDPNSQNEVERREK